MKLKCHQCESNNTVLVPKAKLEKVVGADAMAEPVGIIADPIATIATIVGIVSAIIGYLQYRATKKSHVVVCKDCGFWEKL